MKSVSGIKGGYFCGVSGINYFTAIWRNKSEQNEKQELWE